MTTRIRLLDETTKNLIAAGEVIERPASVAKELVENSLDAGAARIAIETEGAGNRMIRVTDDGTGMSREDAELALHRHATSKISSAEDLEHIATLGFRGEALPSIAVASRFELETCARENTCGTRVVVEGGEIVEVTDASRAPGTTVTVRNLFFNVPARRKFLKTDATEMRHIARVTMSAAIAQIETAFKLSHDSKEVFSVAPCRSVKDRLEDLFGPKRAGRLLPILHEHGDIAVGGLVAAPDSAGGARADQFMFINRRPFHSRSLAHAVRQSYQSAIPGSAQPSFFLFLTMDPGKLDINVHPAKLEVRFRDEGLIYSIVHKAVQQGLRQEGAIADFTSESGGKLISIPRERGPKAGAKIKGHLRDSAAVSTRSKESGFQTSLLMPVKPASGDRSMSGKDPKGLFKTGAPGIEKTHTGELDGSSSRAGPSEETSLPSFWQMHDRYILVETKSGCLIIDQHAAHERILYEKIMADLKKGAINKQRLLFPVTLELNPEEHLAASQFKAILEQGGFQIEEFSGRTLVIHAVPALKNLGGVEDYFRSLLRELVREGQGSTGTRYQALARGLACRGAIKSGKRLTGREMNELVDRLFATELPYADVHGRNTILQLTLDEIDKRFGRS